MMSTAASFPSVRNQGLIDQYEKEITSEGCCWLTLAGRTTGVSNNVEPAHNTTKILCPNDSVRLSISPVLLKQRIKRIEWKEFAEK